MKEKRGITLISLVITVIVLLILAGVAISMALNEGNIFEKANEAKSSWNKDVEEEETRLNSLIATLDEESEVERAILSGNVLSATSTTTLTDEEGNIIKVPAGFKLSADSGTTVRTGIVIEDNDIQTYSDGTKSATGNQYIWIPVTKDANGNNTTPYSTTGKLATGEEIKLSRYLFESGGTFTDKGSSNITLPVARETFNFIEDTTTGSNTHALNINNFKNSVSTNGGYYIARYEASYGNDGKANSKISKGTPQTSGTVNTEGMLWNLISQTSAATASRNLYTTITSDLINSYAWDTSLVYIQKCGGTDYTAYSMQSRLISNISNTGNLIDLNETHYYDNPCNINDLAGNVLEWTTETSNDNSLRATYRGGEYVMGTYASTRINNNPSISSNNVNIGFRVILYL